MALQIAPYKVVISADANFQGGGASILDSGAAVFLNQRQYAQNAAHRSLAVFLVHTSAHCSNLSADNAGAQIGAVCRSMHQKDGETAVRRILGILSLVKKYGGATVEDACAAALEVGVRADYHFVRRYLERHPQLPLSLRQVDPLIRQLTLYRDFIEGKTKESNE